MSQMPIYHQPNRQRVRHQLSSRLRLLWMRGSLQAQPGGEGLTGRVIDSGIGPILLAKKVEIWG
jgi:hypothetical protein